MASNCGAKVHWRGAKMFAPIKRVILTLLCMACALPTLAAESSPLSLSSTKPAFQSFLASLRRAAKTKDTKTIYGALAKNFYVKRDFGGGYDPLASPENNFSAIFEFDNTKLRPEYQDHGWMEFRKALAYTKLERKQEGQPCFPHGAQDRKPVPHPQLCFRRTKPAGWRLSGYVHGGD